MSTRLKVLFILVGLILVIILGYVIYKDYYADFMLFLDPKADRAHLMESIRSHKLKDALLLVALTAVMCAIPGVPNSVIGIFIGVCFGPWIGVLMNVSGNILGNFIVILLLRKYGLSKKAKDPGEFITNILNMKKPAVGITVGYMIPVLPSVIVNYAAVKLKLPLKSLLLAVTIGVLPTSFLYAFGGDALLKGNTKIAILSIVCVVILVFVLRIFQKRQVRSNA
ncbi:TVP38/TMEM64 family protein [Listeria newyorkensis]|uniref:TVP38/TMEM64 family membrane protein n=1 Tax=Listeria newyorkensis TaxID=1497681 RepID=A0A841Z0K5_9LIST|nr:VTT domain-containing protein [Listeria newyorkensis]MBC1459145.1 TVP38/TMEM64 family protein [Listeria newyorkensis]